MPLPWKKNRVTRISQIVADLQSPKRGSSLVVQTGFPTSLIDLFVKNRTRFTKPKSKKPVQPKTTDPPPPPTLSPPHPPPPTEIPSWLDSAVVCAEAPSLTRLVLRNGFDDRGDDGVSGSGWEVIRVGEYGCGSGSKTVLAAVLMMLLAVVVLITSVKMLTVGVTVSAFAFLFLEYAGKRVVSCFGPCSYVNMELIESLTRRVCNCVWFQKLMLKIKLDCEGSIVEGENVDVSELVVGDECMSNSLCLEEIEVVETKSEVDVCCEETSLVGPELDFANEDKKWGCCEIQEESNGEVVESCEISQCEKKGNRRVKFKSKLVKKLVPKKLRGSKKEKKGKKSKQSEAELSSEDAKEDKSPSFEIEEEQGDVGKDEEEIGNRSPLLPKIKLECVREDEVYHGITCSQESSLARVDEVAVNTIEKRSGKVGTSGSGYIILFMITLAGLVVGRFPALIAAMTWCFMLKIVAARGRPQNVPLIKCSISKS